MQLPSQLVFATNNQHKLREVRQIVGDRCKILSLTDIGCHDDIPETGSTLEENALIKARWVAERYGIDCFADDTGLEVDALDGAPGVNSARYAAMFGTGREHSHDSQANMRLLLTRLQGVDHRTARFRTAIAYVQTSGEKEADGRYRVAKESLFEGRVEGTILSSPAGEGGFGYDPVFLPSGYDRTFALMSEQEKNAISHRGRALRVFLAAFTACA